MLNPGMFEPTKNRASNACTHSFRVLCALGWSMRRGKLMKMGFTHITVTA